MAVQVSGVHLAGGEVDPEPLRGIKTFVRDILPRQCHSSPEGGTTPVHDALGFEESPCDNSHLKRKSCRVEDESGESEQSDSEHLPSNKRQRITVSAMRRLFAKFSLSDTDETSQSVTLGGVSQAASGPSDGVTAPQHSPNRTPTPENDTEANLTERTQHSSNPNRCSPITVRSGKRISETDSDEEHGDKRQRTTEDHTEAEEEEKLEKDTEEKEEHHKDSEAEETDKSVASTSEDTTKSNKRQADTRESDTEDKDAPGNKVKRTRRLRRGLRLCTNITCYIEQVLYN